MSPTKLAAVGVIAFALLASAQAQQSNDPYKVSVWATVQFGQDGKVQSISVVDGDQYPAKFLENVTQRLEKARVPSPTLDGKPAVLRSGVELLFTVTPTATGGNVRIDGIAIGPMPTKRVLASYPNDLKGSAGWEGEVVGKCTVSPQGRCSSIDVEALPGMPDSVRKYARASLERWEFEPQRLNDQPIEGEYQTRFSFKTRDARPDKFTQDKFLKLLRAREP